MTTDIKNEVLAELLLMKADPVEYDVDAIVNAVYYSNARHLDDYAGNVPELFKRHRIRWELREADDESAQVWVAGRQVGDVELTPGGKVWRIVPLSRAAHANRWELPWCVTREEAARTLALGLYAL